MIYHHISKIIQLIFVNLTISTLICNNPNLLILCLFMIPFFKIKKLDWFSIAKFLTIIICAIVVYCYIGVYNELIHNLIMILMTINIIEAIFKELEIIVTCNSLVGILLILNIQHYKNQKYETSYMVFPFNWNWIILYTLWNLSFVYSSKCTISTAIILITPIILSLIYGHETWIYHRTISLLVHLIMRVSECTNLYNPKKSFLVSDDIKRYDIYSHIFGFLNLLYCIFTMIKKNT